MWHTNNKISQRLPYLVALSIFFSYLEALLPHPIPFLRFGLANIAVLSSFGLRLWEYLILLVLKAIISSLLSGTLLSPFVLLSLAQSLVSGVLMIALFYLNKKIFKNKLLSLYGISICASCVSAYVQIIVARLYLGKGVEVFLGPMILFSVFSGVLTAFLSYALNIPSEAPELLIKDDGKIKKKDIIESSINICSIILCVIIASTIKSLPLLALALAFAFVMQLASGKKIKILIHLFMWVFIIISALLQPMGEVIFNLWGWKITMGALKVGLSKSLRLSIMMAVSLSMGKVAFKKGGLVHSTQAYLYAIIEAYKKSEGNAIARIQKVLSLDKLEIEFKEKSNSKKILYYTMVVAIIAVFVWDRLAGSR